MTTLSHSQSSDIYFGEMNKPIRKYEILAYCNSFTCAKTEQARSRGVLKETKEDYCPDCGSAIFFERVYVEPRYLKDRV